jgi:hypothetical protein
MRRRALLNQIIFITGLLVGPGAHAGLWRAGASLGYGGVGLTQTVDVNGSSAPVERSEGPGVLMIFADRLMDDTWSLGLEHIRGFRFGPFSTEASLTGFSGRWYFMGPAPAVEKMPEGSSYIFERRFVPFAGLATGIALADISRSADQVPSVSASGIYFGIRLGVDYPLLPGFGIRPEITSSMTLLSQGATPSSVTQFSGQCGFYFLF